MKLSVVILTLIFFVVLNAIAVRGEVKNIRVGGPMEVKGIWSQEMEKAVCIWQLKENVMWKQDKAIWGNPEEVQRVIANYELSKEDLIELLEMDREVIWESHSLL